MVRGIQIGNVEDGSGCGVILIITTEFLERTEEYHEKLRPDTRYCGRDFNLVTVEYERDFWLI